MVVVVVVVMVVVVIIYLHDDVFRTGVVAELEVFHRCLRTHIQTRIEPKCVYQPYKYFQSLRKWIPFPAEFEDYG